MPGPRMKPNAKPHNAKKAIKRVLSYLSESKVLLFIALIAVLFGSLAQVIGTSLLKRIIDIYIEPLSHHYDSDLKLGFIKTLMIMSGVYIIGALSSYLASRLMMLVSTKALCHIRVDLYHKMESLPIRYFDTHTHGELMSRYTNDTDAVREMLSNSLGNMVSSTITIIGVFVMMIIFSWELTIVLILMSFITIKVIKVIGKKSSVFFGKQQKCIGSVNGYIEEMIEGQKVVKVFCHEEKAKENFDTLNDALCDASTNAHTFANILMPIMSNLSHFQYAVIAVVGGVLAINEIITVGTVIAFLQLTRNFTMPITQMSQQINAILTALAGAERIFDLMDETAEEDNGYVKLINAKEENGQVVESDKRTGIWAWKHPHQDGTITYTKLKGDVLLDQVVFGYEPGVTVLDNITLHAMPGEKIAFVGSTGAGKTTITNLLNRFYDVPDGKIRYDGININKIKKDDLRRSMAMVLQDTHLFTGTIKDNIRYGKMDATDEEIVAAAKLANAHFFITHLPQGYETVITADGANLSQGQRQLLAIARAAVADPPVLILDEATSSIDTRTERLIEKGMDQLMEGRTVFVIAHRLSTVRNSDAIMVLEKGKIIERGNHEELLAKKGRYYQLYTGMFELS